MQRIFDFNSDSSPYVADAAVVCCFDERIRRVTNEFLRKRGILRPDMIVLAGGALRLATSRTEFERTFIVEQIRLAIELHQTRRVLLMSHSDCATYGGLAAFNRNADEEMAHHQAELSSASKIVSNAFPGITTEAFFATFDGVLGLQRDR